MRTWRLLAAGAILAVAACGDSGEPQPNVVPADTRDAQLLYTLQAGTEWIAAVGRDAQARASSDAARQFAATLAADHDGLHAVFESAQRPDLLPAESAAGLDLITNAQTTRVGLESLEGPAYDLAFVESAIRLQQQLLSAVERDLTVLQDSTLRDLAEQTRPTLQAHIQRGRQLLPELRWAEAVGVSRQDAAGGDGEGAPRRAPGPRTLGEPIQRDTSSTLQPGR